MLASVVAVLGSKILIAFLTPLLIYGAAKLATLLDKKLPSELIPVIAAALGAGIDQVQGVQCPVDMNSAACASYGALMGLAGVGVHQLLVQLRAAINQGGFTPPASQE